MFIVHADGGIDVRTVDDGRVTRIGADGTDIIHRQHQSQGLHHFVRGDRYLVAQRDVIEMDIIAFLKPVVGDLLVVDLLFRRGLQHVIER